MAAEVGTSLDAKLVPSPPGEADGAKMGGKEGYAVPIRDPNTPAVTDDEFLRLAEAGHVAGVVAFTTAAENKGRVDAPRVDAPRHVSGSTALVMAAKAGRVEVIPLLLEAGAGVDVPSKIGWTALIFGAENGHAPVVEMLLAAGADKDLQNNVGMTALILGAQKGHAPVVEMLLAAGADKDLQLSVRTKYVQTKGASALVMSAYTGHDKCLDLLIKAGARLDIKSAGSTALGWANKKNYPKCVALLEAANAP